MSDCGKYLVLMTSKSCRDNLVYFADLEATGDIRGKLELTQIIFELVSDYEYVTNTGPKVVFRTNRNAPNYRLIVIDFNDPAEEKWQTLVAEHELDVLEYVQCVNNDKLIIEYIHDVKVKRALGYCVFGISLQFAFVCRVFCKCIRCRRAS